MCALDQCIEILNLTSLDWKKSRIAVVAHSFRVMSRARNYDEMVVGIMHHIYASSGYARGLFSCDVYNNSIWKEALDLFVEKRKKLKTKRFENLPDEVLLSINMDQDMKKDSAKIEEWMTGECKWSSIYKKKIERIGANRIARNVMIYDLEDKLEMLIHPEKFQEEGSEQIALPWKTDYIVDVFTGRNTIAHTRIPDTDDTLLLRPLTNNEKADLVEKYSRAISLLMRMECSDGPRECDFPKEKISVLSDSCMAWYEEWLSNERAWEELNEEENGNEQLFS